MPTDRDRFSGGANRYLNIYPLKNLVYIPFDLFSTKTISN